MTTTFEPRSSPPPHHPAERGPGHPQAGGRGRHAALPWRTTAGRPATSTRSSCRRCSTPASAGTTSPSAKSHPRGDREAKKLTPELREHILGSFDAEALEDLYLPFSRSARPAPRWPARPASRPWPTGSGTPATAARRPRRARRWSCGPSPSATRRRAAPTWRACCRGPDLLTERLAEQSELRQAVREAVLKRGCVVTAKGEKAGPPQSAERYLGH